MEILATDRHNNTFVWSWMQGHNTLFPVNASVAYM